MVFTQADRRIAIQTPLGDDVLLLRAMRGRESISQLFRFEVELLSSERTIAAEQLLGKIASIVVRNEDRPERYFHGIITQFSAGAPVAGGELRHYRALLAPSAWFLTQQSNCRIFQNLSVPQIVAKVLTGIEFVDETTGDYAPRGYCVQYRETDWAFVSRLLEEEGILYFFRHTTDKHTLVLADNTKSYKPCSPATAQVGYGNESIARLESWHHVFEYRPGKWTYRDFDFQKPTSDLTAQTETVLSLSGVKTHEHYDFPGDYRDKPRGTALTKLRVEAEEADYSVIDTASSELGLLVGSKFKLTDYDVDSENGEYVITSLEHAAEDDSYLNSGTDRSTYRNTVRAAPAARVIRPRRSTPRPVVLGPQTAIVTGPQGAEIFSDEFGRVKVQFHWDRDGKHDENTSCWVRVAHPEAGQGWGAIALPRVGQEVVVDFLEGNPDRPLITGRVYNQDQPAPYKLPDNQTRSTFKTRSTPGGNETTFNELRFEDKKDKEEIYFHAERDFNRVVENNDTLKVGFDKKSPGSQTIDVYQDRTTTLDQGTDKLQIKTGDRIALVDKGHDTITIAQGNRTTEIKQGNDSLTITQGNLTVQVSAGKVSIEAGTSIELKVGGSTLKMEPAAIELKCGGSSVKLDPSNVQIKGVQVAVQGDAKVDVKAAMTTVAGDGMTKVTGGVVQIN